MFVNILLLIIGFIVLIKGADFFVDGASSIASNLKVPKMVIALTIVAFGTSAPEFSVSMKSMLSGSGELVLGNVIGSNIINILLILGISAIIRPLYVKSNTVKKELPILLMITTLLAVVFCDSTISNIGVNTVSRSDGIILLLFFLVFIYYLFSVIRNRSNNDNEIPQFTMGRSILLSVLGILAIVLGSELVVQSSIQIAGLLGISERLIGLTIVALGTSLPELVTSVVAAKKNEIDLAVGNIIGSNIFNIGIVLALPTAMFGNIIPIEFNMLDIVVMLVSTVLLFCFSADDNKISRKEGIIMLILFILYYGHIIIEGVI